MLIFSPEALQKIFNDRFEFPGKLFAVIADVADGIYCVLADLSAFRVLADNVVNTVYDVVLLKLLEGHVVVLGQVAYQMQSFFLQKFRSIMEARPANWHYPYF